MALQFHIDSRARSEEKSGTQIDTFSSGRFSNLKRRLVIAMGGSVFADVGREACGPA
jgi:hypothetical protein